MRQRSPWVYATLFTFSKYAPLECESETWKVHWQVRVLLVTFLSTPAWGQLHCVEKSKPLDGC